MKVTSTSLAGVLLIEPAVWEDERGLVFESWSARKFAAATGVDASFVQDNHSRSREGVLRGIHYQVVCPQGKLVRVISGAVLDVVVDLRRSSPTFGKWMSIELSADNMLQLWIPPGYGHGFLALSESEVLYKTTNYWSAQFNRRLYWKDPTLSIAWPLVGGKSPILSASDEAAPSLDAAELYD